MAISVSCAVWEHSKAKGNTRLVLLALADFVFEDSIQAEGAALAWPSQGTLAKRCNCSRSTVELALEQLRDEGEIEDTGKKKGGRYRGTTVWSVLPEHLDAFVDDYIPPGFGEPVEEDVGF